MRVEVLGDGTPEVAVVAGVHGDEPCGVRAVEELLAADPAVDRPVKLVVANEAALAAGDRYVDEDLNRAFPGDPDAGTHEGRLAAGLAAELQGMAVLALHSTQSYGEPFAVVDALDDGARAVCSRLPVAAVVETGTFVDGRLFAADCDVVEVECGLQGSGAAARNAGRVVRAFLAALGALPDPEPARTLPAYRLVRRVPKAPAEGYEVLAENFERVAPGEAFAAADGERLVAESAFYPVLMSPEGYADVWGYAAERVDAA